MQFLKTVLIAASLGCALSANATDAEVRARASSWIADQPPSAPGSTTPSVGKPNAPSRTKTPASPLSPEALVRKNLAERIPQFQKIDEVTKSPVAGLYEIRINGTEIFYTDGEGNFLIQGSIIDTRQRRNLTEERIDKLTVLSVGMLLGETIQRIHTGASVSLTYRAIDRVLSAR